MDDLDEFLDNIPVTPQTDRHPAMDTDEDFLAFLDTPTTFTRPPGDADTTGKFSLTTQSVDDGQDFLDWLQESSSTKNISSTNLPAIAEDVLYSPNTSFIDTSPKAERVSSAGSAKEVSKDMDNFFNEVFGSPSPSTKSRKTFSMDASEADDVHLSFEEQVQSIVQSAFPDIQQLRRIVLAAGYVPAPLRAEVWSLLLNETCAEDVEVLHYSSSDGVECENGDSLTSDVAALVSSLPGDNYVNQDELRKDMHDILSLYCQRRQIAYSSVLCRLLSPLLAVPQRASRAQASSCFYNVASEFAPLINLNPAAYSLSVSATHSWLRLLLSYHSPALVQHLDRVVPHWEHPAAEMSTHQSVRTAATQKRNSELDELEKELGLDLLDTVGNDNKNISGDGSTAEGAAGSLIESALPVREQSHHHHRTQNSGNIGIAGIASSSRPNNSNNSNNNNVTGLVPTHWITGIFTGSLPPLQAAQVLDYAVLTNCNFAGVYFSAALLHIYSSSLLTMTGPRIRQWFDTVALNNADWYRNIAVSGPGKVGEKGEVSTPESWESFVNGWIHCTTALIRSTPQAFKDSLHRVSEWATLKAEYRNNAAVHAAMRPRSNNNRKKATSELDKISHGGNADPAANSGTSDTMSSNNTSAVNSDAEGEYSDSENIDGEEIADSSTKNTFMSQFRRFSTQFTPEQVEKEAMRAQRVAKLNSFPHEKVYNGGANAPLCLTASVEEVIPCICSNKRRAIAPDDLLECFYTAAFTTQINPITTTTAIGSSGIGSGIISTSGNVFARFANATEMENTKPFYFGIDCRSVQERALGQFPKAYAFDPILLTDSDEIVKLLDMVETMAATAHLCLIGAGEGYLRWVYEQQTSSKYRKYQNNPAPVTGGAGNSGNASIRARDPPELVRAFEDYYSKLNAVAMFFLKRSFKHVSILSGGFMAAAQYLHLPDSPLSLTAALVDSDRGALESLLGIVPHTTGPTKRDSLVSYLPETSALLSVTSYFTTKGSNNPSSAALDTANNSTNNNSGVEGGNSSGKVASRSASPVPTRDNTAVPGAPASVASSAPAAASSTATSTAPAAATATANTAPVSEAPSVLSSWGKKLTMFSSTSLETIKKGVASSVAAVSAVQESAVTTAATTTGGGNAAVAAASEEEGYEDDGMGPREFADTTSISISTTEREKQQALSLHRMAGLRKGDKVMINRTDLPGAILFPSIKYKEVWVEVPATEPAAEADTVASDAVEGDPGASVPASGVNTTVEGGVSSAVTTSEGESPEKPVAVEGDNVDSSAAATTTKVAQQTQVHRYLVVSRERFLVLDASGGGVGSEAVVKSNRHLTELMKMTFKKKDPELVTLYFVSPDIPTGKARQYRVSKRQEFVTALQKNMERFK